MPSKRRPNFVGALNKPFVIKLVDVLSGTAVEDLRVIAWRQKFPLLLQHYNINKPEPQCWFELAFELATDFVPGLQISLAMSQRGRKRKWLIAERRKFV